MASELKFERLKLPPSGTMSGVSFHCADLRTPGSLVLFGGQRRGLSNSLWQFSPGEDSWTEHPMDGDWPAARTQATLTGVGPLEGEGRILYLFGGSALDVGAVSDLWALSIGTDAALAEYSWTKVSTSGPVPPRRYGHSAIAWGSKLVVFGGQDDARQFNDAWVFNTTSMEWAELTTKGAAPSTRTRHTATLVAGDKMIVLGGFSRDARYLGDAHLLDLSSRCWAPLPLCGDEFISRAQHATATFDGTFVFLFGGYSGAKNLNDLHVLNVPTGRVAQLHCSTLPEARCRHSVHFLNETQLFLAGGFDGAKP
jgi:hypothetical protein